MKIKATLKVVQGDLMRRQFERMMRLRAFSIFFGVLFALAICAMIAVILILNTGDYHGTNGDFGEYSASGEEQSKTYKFEEFKYLYFFSRDYKGELTLFTSAIPNLRIVNSDRYEVVVRSNKEILDKLEFNLIEDSLVIDFNEKLYKKTGDEGQEYKGLYVECSNIDVTVYAPISYLNTDAEINLNYDAPKADNIIVLVKGEARECNIKNIDCQNLIASFCGNSNVTISGKATGTAQVIARHNSSIDATGFAKPKKTDSTISCQLFGFSSIEYKDDTIGSYTEAGFVITWVSIAILLVLGGLVVMFRVKFFKQKKEIDIYIEKAKKEERYLKIPKKTEENVLQNEE